TDRTAGPRVREGPKRGRRRAPRRLPERPRAAIRSRLRARQRDAGRRHRRLRRAAPGAALDPWLRPDPAWVAHPRASAELRERVPLSAMRPSLVTAVLLVATSWACKAEPAQ